MTQKKSRGARLRAVLAQCDITPFIGIYDVFSVLLASRHCDGKQIMPLDQFLPKLEQVLKKCQSEIQQQACGGHADELGTSIMLVIEPRKVDMSRAMACNEQSICWPFNSPTLLTERRVR